MELGTLGVIYWV